MDSAQDQEKTLADSPGYEPGTHEGFGRDGADAILDSSLDQDSGGVNIVILKVIDKATGERLTDLEDAQVFTGITPEGDENTVKTAKGRKVATGFALVEAEDLIASHDEHGQPNPDYPAELQPRDRGRESSIAWVRKTAQQLDPDSLGKTRRADTGAPIVGPDRVVESGNGRTMAIREAYRSGRAEEYREWLTEEAESFGLNPARVKAMRHPVLVRVRTSGLDRREFAIEANQDDKLAMTATEKARADADRLDSALLSRLSDGDLLAAANREFVRGFLASLGDTEAAQYLTTDGQPTASLVARIQAAVFAKAYADDRLLELTADAGKPEIANIVAALNTAAPEFIRAQAANKDATDALSGQVASAAELSLDKQAVQAIIEATNLVRKAKADGQDITDVVAQRGLFDDIDPVVATMAVFISKNNRSGKRLAAAFGAMARHIREEAERGHTVDMFGDNQRASMEDIIAAANRELDKIYGEGEFAIDTPDLFGGGFGQREPEPEPENDPLSPPQTLKRGERIFLLYSDTVGHETQAVKSRNRSIQQRTINGTKFISTGRYVIAKTKQEALALEREGVYYETKELPDYDPEIRAAALKAADKWSSAYSGNEGEKGLVAENAIKAGTMPEDELEKWADMLDEIPEPESFNPATYLTFAADDIASLRKADVERVLSDLEGEELAAMADYIRQNRPDLADEVNDILGEAAESEPEPAPQPTPSAKFSPGDTVYLFWPATDQWEPVNYRGPVDGGKAMVVKDGSQFTVDMTDLRRDKPQAESEPAADPQAAADRTLLQSVIDGTVADILSPSLADELIELYERHGGENAEWADPELKRLAEAAMDAYEKAAMEAPVPTL